MKDESLLNSSKYKRRTKTEVNHDLIKSISNKRKVKAKIDPVRKLRKGVK
jgi:hypothetical protein